MDYRHTLLGCMLALTISLPATAANRPAGYKTLCTEGQTCSLATVTHVAFGRADKFVYKDLTGTFACSAVTFSTTSVPGGKNECSIPVSSSSSSKSSSSVSSSANSSRSSSSSSNSSAVGGITGSACKASTGTVTINLGVSGGGITVPAGTVFDGGCKTYVFVGYCEQCEAGEWSIKVNDGATLKNMILQGANSGIALYGNTTLENISTDKVFGYYLVSQRSAGNSTINNVTVKSAIDRVFQTNAAGTMKVSNVIARDIAVGVFRQNGGTTFPSKFICDRCDVGLAPYMFRTDGPSSTAQLSNSVLTGVPKICFGYASDKCTLSNVTIK